MGAVDKTLTQKNVKNKETANLEKSCSKPLRLRRAGKNLRRKLRRKRSLTRYYSELRRSRHRKSIENLDADLSTCDISDYSIDMEIKPITPSNSQFNDGFSEIFEWQKCEQVAYWKSRAISLEFENRMLHRHLRNVYAQWVENNEDNKYKGTLLYEKDISLSEFKDEELINGNSDGETSNTMEQDQTEDEHNTEEQAKPRIAAETRREGMKKIYGENYEKIMGMETAVQLNYERHLEQSNAVRWPGIPLNLQC